MGASNRVSPVQAVSPTGQWAPPDFKIFYYSNSAQTRKFKKKTFLPSKNTQILHDVRFEYFEQLSQLGQLHISTDFDEQNLIRC
jgi:hypothetical protein